MFAGKKKRANSKLWVCFSFVFNSQQFFRFGFCCMILNIINLNRSFLIFGSYSPISKNLKCVFNSSTKPKGPIHERQWLFMYIWIWLWLDFFVSLEMALLPLVFLYAIFFCHTKFIWAITFKCFFYYL